MSNEYWESRETEKSSNGEGSRRRDEMKGGQTPLSSFIQFVGAASVPASSHSHTFSRDIKYVDETKGTSIGVKMNQITGKIPVAESNQSQKEI